VQQDFAQDFTGSQGPFLRWPLSGELQKEYDLSLDFNQTIKEVYPLQSHLALPFKPDLQCKESKGLLNYRMSKSSVFHNKQKA
jgi:hypothetical protein